MKIKGFNQKKNVKKQYLIKLNKRHRPALKEMRGFGGITKTTNNER